MNEQPPKSEKYTCDDYRAEMRLLGMRQQLNDTNLTDSERLKLQNEIDQLENEIGLS